MMTTSISSLSSQIASSLFSKIDTKNQGYIDKAELSSTSSDSSNSDADDAFNALDSDSDGKVTKSELTKGIENLLSSLSSSSVNGQENGSRPAPPDGPPPNGNGDESDSGMTKDQMTKMASETKDSKLSSMLKDVSSNFDSADTNKDGKVSREEAMAYEKSKENSSSDSNSSSATTASNSSGNEVAMKKIAELLAKYASDSTTASTASSSSSVSVTA